MNDIYKIKEDLRLSSNRGKSKVLAGFFKTGEGQYGEGDVFIGVNVPDCRKVARKYTRVDLDIVKRLIESKIHEERLTGLLILVDKYEKFGDNKKEIVDFYLNNLKGVNNWDLVDLTAPKILGDYLLNFVEDRKVLYEFADSGDLWKRRISIVSCYTFIRVKKFEDCLKISEILLNDEHDLIHKAVGWMLREVGKRDVNVLENFLKKHYRIMPRTMLRYAIEKFSKEKKDFYMSKVKMFNFFL